MPDPAMDLRSAILGELAAGSAEASHLARRLGVSRERVLRELEVMALRDLVDAHEPPPPLRLGSDALVRLPAEGGGGMSEAVFHNDPAQALWWFLRMIQAAGGNVDASDCDHSPINVFCSDFEPLDTFNLARERGFISVGHDTRFDTSTAYLLKAGEDYLNDNPPLKSWRCFHCDEVFADPGAAADHFGRDLHEEPGCIQVLLEGEKAIVEDRQRLRGHGFEEPIRTVWGRGYVLETWAATRMREVALGEACERVGAPS